MSSFTVPQAAIKAAMDKSHQQVVNKEPANTYQDVVALTKGMLEVAAPHIIEAHEVDKWKLIESAPLRKTIVARRKDDIIMTVIVASRPQGKSNTYWDGHDEFDTCCPSRGLTHWQPLPQPPKEAWLITF